MDLRAGYREWAPPAALAGSVTCLWASVVPPACGQVGLGASGGAGLPSPGADRAGPEGRAGTAPGALVLPDACVDLIWQAGRGLFVAGPDTGPAPATLPAGTVLVGARFGPGAGGAALGMPLSALLDQRVDAADLGSALGRRLAVAVAGSLTPELALRELTRTAAGVVAESPADTLVAAAARLLDRPGASVAEVAAGLGISERQLRRRCEAAAGYGPATLRRVLRFRRFVSRVDAGEVNGRGLAMIAAEAGYADQAHLTRECGEFSGLSPAALAAVRRPA